MEKKIKRHRNLFSYALFRRYFLNTIIVLLASIIVIGFVMTMVISAQWWDEKVKTLTGNVNDIAKIVANSDFEMGSTIKNGKVISNTLDVISSATNSDYFITDSLGNIIICRDGAVDFEKKCAKHSSMKITPEYMKRAINNGFSDYANDDVFGFGKFVVATPVNLKGGEIGAVYAVEDAITGLLPYVMNVVKILMIVILVALSLSIIIVYFLSKSITLPISEMQDVTKSFARGEFENRANENYKQQYLSEFAKSLNKMADDLAAEEEAQKSFVANVSHELKTPMTTIGGFIDGILDGTIPPEKERKYLQTVSDEVKRLSRTVVSMLNLSKIESGEVSISPVRYDISAQIIETILPFENRISASQIEIEGLEEMGQVYINADKDLIQQVIYNLIDNAVKFTPQGGTISFFAKNENGKTMVTIRNTGKGVSNEEISHIFERFYKVDKSRSYDQKGVGLGLYIVKTIVNMHGGEIKASSVEDKYTQFAFEIPNYI